MKPWRDIGYSGLIAKDFEIFEDGRKQVVQSVTIQNPLVSDISDSSGEHYEKLGAGEGRWIYPDLPHNGITYAVFSWPVYLIAYSPPPSLEGSCHRVTVRVNAPHADYWGGGRYCRTNFAESDPLNGAKFGKQLEADLDSATPGKIDLKMAAVSLIDGSSQGRVSLSIEFQSRSLQYHYEGTDLHETIGMLARAYRKDGTIAARFSDFDCCDVRTTAGFGDFLDTSVVARQRRHTEHSIRLRGTARTARRRIRPSGCAQRRKELRSSRVTAHSGCLR